MRYAPADYVATLGLLAAMLREVRRTAAALERGAQYERAPLQRRDMVMLYNGLDALGEQLGKMTLPFVDALYSDKEPPK